MVKASAQRRGIADAIPGLVQEAMLSRITAVRRAILYKRSATKSAKMRMPRRKHTVDGVYQPFK